MLFIYKKNLLIYSISLSISGDSFLTSRSSASKPLYPAAMMLIKHILTVRVLLVVYTDQKQVVLIVLQLLGIVPVRS